MTYETNVIGALNVLEAARNCSSVKVFVNITSDKCYENKEVDYGYCETDPMGGYDMYSSSKGCAEILTSSYRRSFLNDGKPFLLASGRAGNVIGGGDWALDRLVPDCARFISKNEPIVIRNPVATRPWQHVLEPLSGYLLLAQKLLNGEKEFADGFNFGPEDDSILTVAEVARKVVRYWEHGEVTVNKPDNLHEANLLKLNIEKAKNLLKWNPTYSADQAIQKTVEWYKNFYNNEQMYDFTLKQINEYAEVCKNNGKITQKSC
jgi:CDP-glucose 4,6-dehydratase